MTADAHPEGHGPVEDIPAPAILDPDRPRLAGKEEATADDLAAQSALLTSALHEVCDYAQHLWTQVANARRYLMDTLPDPDSDDDHRRLLTAPRGPDDQHGWQEWQTAYASLTATLAGPRPDPSFGRYEAAQAALARRGPRHSSARLAELTDAADTHRLHIEEQAAAWADPTLESELATLDPDDPQLPPSLRPDPPVPAAAIADEDSAGSGWAIRSKPARAVLTLIATVLVVRGLRPRQVIRVEPSAGSAGLARKGRDRRPTT